MSKSNDSKSSPENWVNLYSDYLYSYAISRINDSELAYDLVQDTFLAALKARNTFEGRSSEKTWLISILKRKIIDQYRKQGRNLEHKLIDSNHHEGKESLPFESEGMMEGSWKSDRTPNNWNIEPDSALENNELKAILQKCISLLPEKWRPVFTMRVVDEINSDEVCKELDISSSNLWVILHRAKLQLRECIENKWLT